MALIMSATAITKTNEENLVPGATISEEGQALAFTKVNGETFLQPSLGLAEEEFAGLALARPIPQNFQVKIQEFVLGEDETILARLPHPGQILVKIGGVAATAQNAGDTAPTDAGEVTLNGAELLFAADDIAAKKKVFVQYQFELTASEARAITGDLPIGGISANIRGRAPYIELGDVAITNFDAASDWAANDAFHPRLGAGGILTLRGPGAVLKNVFIKSAPTTEKQYLMLSLK